MKIVNRVILHVDMNCFFASVELLYRPEYRGKPVAVGGSEKDRKGIVLAATYEAKGNGIKTGMTLREAYELCPDLTVFPPDFEKYIRFSRMAREIYEEYTNQVENFSVDEAWLDITNCACLLKNTPWEIAEEIRERVKVELGLTVSIGISDNKVFAKLGSDYKKPDACTIIDSDNYREVAWPLPVENLLLVGRETRKKLNAHGIRTIGDLAQSPSQYLHSLLGKNGELLHTFANGRDTSPVQNVGIERAIKSVGNGTTVPRDMETVQDASIVLTMLSESVAQRLRDHGCLAKTITVGMRRSDLKWFERQVQLICPTNLCTAICSAALNLLLRENCEEKGERLKTPLHSVSITASGLIPETESVQTSVFVDTEQTIREERLERTIDDLRRRFGHNCIKRAITILDSTLGYLNAREEHVVHPVGYWN